jgi:glycerol-3-phosphate dehydrogenase (NAD(P)+)
VPSHSFRGILGAIRPHLQSGARIAWATKGFEHDSGRLPHEVVREVLGKTIPVAVLSGPTFASEVGAGLPTAMTIAANEPGFAAELAVRLSGLNFRAYTSEDMIGVEVGGAVKNVLAIAAGISDGLGFGANTRIALITRGLLEMTRLGAALGAQPATFTGLSGMGDLVLSCTDDQSRNRRLGLMVAAGKSPAEAAAAIGQVVEGTFAAVSVKDGRRPTGSRNADLRAGLAGAAQRAAAQGCGHGTDGALAEARDRRGASQAVSPGLRAPCRSTEAGAQPAPANSS